MLKMKSKHVVGTITKKKKSKLPKLIDAIQDKKLVNIYIYIKGINGGYIYDSWCVLNKYADVVLEVCMDMPAWPGRHLFDGGDQRRYFGLKTESRGIVEFECKTQTEYEFWTRGVSRLLSIVAERKTRR